MRRPRRCARAGRPAVLRGARRRRAARCPWAAASRAVQDHSSGRNPASGSAPSAPAATTTAFGSAPVSARWAASRRRSSRSPVATVYRSSPVAAKTAPGRARMRGCRVRRGGGRVPHRVPRPPRRSAPSTGAGWRHGRAARVPRPGAGTGRRWQARPVRRALRSRGAARRSSRAASAGGARTGRAATTCGGADPSSSPASRRARRRPRAGPASEAVASAAESRPARPLLVVEQRPAADVLFGVAGDHPELSAPHTNLLAGRQVAGSRKPGRRAVRRTRGARPAGVAHASSGSSGRRGRRAARDPFGVADELVAGARGQQHQCSAVVRSGLAAAPGGRRVLLQHHVRVGAARAEGAHPRAARGRRRPGRAGPFGQLGAAGGTANAAKSIFGLSGLRVAATAASSAVPHLQQHLGQPGDARGRLQMADVRLDRADARRPRRPPQCSRKRLGQRRRSRSGRPARCRCRAPRRSRRVRGSTPGSSPAPRRSASACACGLGTV